MMPWLGRKLLHFASVLVPAFLLMAWPFCCVGRGFRWFMCWWVNGVIMHPTDAPDVARLLPDTKPGRDWHATAAVWNQPTQTLGLKMDVDLHQAAYVPLVLFVALSFAGRATLGRKYFPVRLQVLGIVLLVARSSLRYILLRRNADGLLHRAPFDLLLQIANLSLGAPLGMAYAFPLILWLVLFRRAVTEMMRPQQCEP
jgi:hypothetical protein